MKFRYLLPLLFAGVIMQNAWGKTSDGPRSPSSASGGHWTNPTYCYSSNDQYAVYNRSAQEYLIATGCGFSIPAGSTIDTLGMYCEGNGTSSTEAQRRIELYFTLDGSTVCGNAWTFTMNQTTDTTGIKTLSGEVWSCKPTVAQVNASTFGIMLRDADATAAAINIDHLQIRLVYTEPSGNMAVKIKKLQNQRGENR